MYAILNIVLPNQDRYQLAYFECHQALVQCLEMRDETHLKTILELIQEYLWAD